MFQPGRGATSRAPGAAFCAPGLRRRGPPGDTLGRISACRNVPDCVTAARAGIPAGPWGASYFAGIRCGLDFARSGRGFLRSGLAPPRPPR